MLLFGLKKQNNENLLDITFNIFSKNPVMVIEGFFLLDLESNFP